VPKVLSRRISGSIALGDCLGLTAEGGDLDVLPPEKYVHEANAPAD